MDPEKPRRNRKKFLLGVFLFAVVAVLLAMAAAFFVTFGPGLLNLSRSNALDSAIKLRENDTEAGNAAAEKVFADARAANIGVGAQMALYRQYAEALYKNDDLADGDAVADKGIALCPGDPPADSNEADILTHLYQDKGGAHYYAYVKNRKLDNGAKDQEKSLAVAEKAFGPDHQQTIYKAPTLALIYADSGRADDAEKIMQRCLESIRTKDSSHPAAWFVYSTLAHMRAIQHRYPEAVKAFMEACSVAADQTQKERAWTELEGGLKQSQPQQDTDWKKADALLTKGKFDELDRMLSNCVAKQESVAMGDWALDEYYWGLDGGYNNYKDEQFAQTTNDLKRWISAKPHTAFARAALAHACVFSFWGMRNSTHPSKESGRLMQDRLTVAREMLDFDSALKNKNPSAYSAEVRLLLAEGRDKDAILKVVEECHKAFPTYRPIDFWAAKDLSGRWLGTDEEAEKYIQSRAAQVGSPKGDEVFTQIYHYLASTEQNILDLPGKSSPEWKRMKSGYNRIFVDYPNDMDARLQAISDAVRCGDSEFISHVFDEKRAGK